MPPVEPAVSVVRVLGAAGTAGTGFVVNAERRLVATCAHVVEIAGGGPGSEVRLVFHATGEAMTALVEPAYWRASTADDVAILRLSGPVPDGVESVRLGSSAASRDHPFRTFGFPRVKSVDGLAATGTITDRNEVGVPRLQLSNASEVAVGFSGAPLLDPVARRVVGMVVEILAPDQGRFFETAFGVPTETLIDICPELQAAALCPYRELNAFDESDAEFFFGRTDAVNRLLSALRRDPGFLAVLGPSGSGKSSLMRAGLLPSLRAGALPGSERWGVVVSRPADLASLEVDLPGVSVDAAAAAGAWLAQHPGYTRLVIVLDQFEEAFVVLDDDTRSALLAGLGAAVSSPAPVSVLLTMRDEFYSRFVREAPTLARALEGGLRNIPPELTRVELTQIVEGPAGLVGLRFDDGLVTRIVNDAIDLSPGRSRDSTATTTVLPLLELALTQLWEGARDGVLSHATYERIGRVTGGLARWADEALDVLGEPLLPVVRYVLTTLVHLGDEAQGTPDSRRRRLTSSLPRQEGEAAQVGTVVTRLADARLIITAEGTVELIHDALLREWGRLSTWLNEDRRFLTWKQELETRQLQWASSQTVDGRDEERLLHGYDLQVAIESRTSHMLEISAEQHRYIDESLAVWEREQRRLRDALTEAQAQRAIAETQLAAANLREQASRVLTLLPLEPVAGLAVAASAMIWNVEHLPDNLVAPVQASLHAALRVARERHVGTGHTAPVTVVLVAPNGRFLISGGADRTVRRWTLNGRLLGDAWLGHTDAVTAVAVDPSGRFLISGSADRTLRRWTLDGQPVGDAWLGHTDAVTAVAVDPAGQFVVSGGADRTIRRWTVDGQPLGEPWLGHTDGVTAVAVDPDGHFVVSGSSDHTLRRWAVDGGDCAPWTGHSDAVTAIAIKPDGRTVASGSADRTIQLWTRDGVRVGNAWTGHTDAVTAVCFDPTGRRLASAGVDGTVRLWGWRGRPSGPPMVGHRNAVGSVAFADDGRTIVSGGADGTVRVWDCDGYAATAVLAGHGTDVNGVVLLDGDRRIVSCGADGFLREWTSQGQPIGSPWAGHDGYVFNVVGDATGRRLASAGEDGTVRLWEALTGLPIGAPVRMHAGSVYAICFHPDGSRLASGGADATVRIFRSDGTDVATLRGHTDEVWAVAFNPAGTLLASAGYDGTVRLWRPDGTAVAGPLLGHEDEICDLAFAPDGRWLVTASVDRTLRRWTSDGAPIGEPLHGHTEGVYAVAVSGDGRLIISGGGEGALRLWDSDGNPVSELLEGHTDAVRRIAIGGDGRFLVSASGDGTLRTWQGGWRAWLEQACQRLAGHPGPRGEYAATARSVREAVSRQPWA
jgi:WD40 repeat protein